MKRFVVFVALLLGGASDAFATPVTLDFESFPNPPGGSGIVTHGTTISEDGFTLVTNAVFGGFASYSSSSSFYLGSVMMFANTLGAGIVLTQDNGGPFSISSIALAFTNSAQPGSAPLTFTGIKADSSTVEQTFSVSAVLQNFNFAASFSNLTALMWSQPSTASHQFDNVVVDGAPVTSAPSPGALALLGLGLVGVATRRRRV